MAKIGTAHIEIKPVLDEATLDAIAKRIEDAVAEGVRRGMVRDVIAVGPPTINVSSTGVTTGAASVPSVGYVHIA